MAARLAAQTKRVREPLSETGNQAPLPDEEGILHTCWFCSIFFFLVVTMACENLSVFILKQIAMGAFTQSAKTGCG